MRKLCRNHVMKTLLINCLDYKKLEEFKERIKIAAQGMREIQHAPAEHHFKTELKAIENIEDIIYRINIKYEKRGW